MNCGRRKVLSSLLAALAALVIASRAQTQDRKIEAPVSAGDKYMSGGTNPIDADHANGQYGSIYCPDPILKPVTPPVSEVSVLHDREFLCTAPEPVMDDTIPIAANFNPSPDVYIFDPDAILQSVPVTPNQVQADGDQAAFGVWAEISKGENISTGAYIEFASGDSLFEPGAIVQAFTSYDRYFYNDFDGARVTGETTEFDILIGTNFDLGRAWLRVLAGPTVVYDSLSSPSGLDFDNTTLGARVAAATSIKFSEGTNLSLAGQYKTVRDDYVIAGSLLFPIGNGLAIGPSAQLKGNESNRELKVGPILSGIKVEDIYLTLSGGISFQNGQESVYFGLSTWSSF